MKEKHPKNQVNLTDLISKKLEKALVEAVNKAYPELKISEVLVEIPKDRDHGDFTTPISLKIAKQIGENPLKIAENIHKNCKTPAQIEKSNILPPGFIMATRASTARTPSATFRSAHTTLSAWYAAGKTAKGASSSSSAASSRSAIRWTCCRRT